VNKHKKIYWLLFIIIISCNKKPFDYRNKYIGDWEFNIDITEFNTSSVGYYYHDSLTYMGQIKYGNEDDNLLIEYSSNNSITLKIDKENILTGFPTAYCGGEFDGNNKLHLYLRWGGLGGRITHVVDGEKK
jgi:hypothetical protein